METGTLSATTPSTPPGTAAAPSQSLDKNAFLKLLVAQLQHQDPTNTQDPSEMIQQLTGFSTLEQITALGTQIQGLQVQTQGLFQAQVAGLVGKKIMVPGTTVALQDGQGTIGLKLAGNAQQVTITIKDAAGNVVRTISQGAMNAGQQKVAWDGKSAQGTTLPDGTYTVEASATDAGGKPVNVTTTSYLKVDAVSFKDGVVFLVAGGKTYSLSDVTEIAA